MREDSIPVGSTLGQCARHMNDRPSPHPNRWLVLLLVSSAVFLITVDMTVLHTALPTLTRALGASASDKLWIVNAYSLVVAGLLPGTGTLGDKVGHKRMLVIGLV